MVLVVALSLAPAVVAVITAFTPSRGPVLSYGGFTTVHMMTALTKSATPLWNSLSLAAIATVAGVIFSRRSSVERDLEAQRFAIRGWPQDEVQVASVKPEHDLT